MKKFSLFALILTALLAQDDTYVFEAKGELAQELKEVVNKHAKDGNSDIKVYKAPQERVKDSRFLATGLNKNINYNAQKGEEIYNAKCLRCHGEKGTKLTNAGVRRLSQMTGQEIFTSFNAYFSDDSHGQSARIAMQPIAASTSSTDLGYIIAYLKGENDYIFTGSDDETENSNISTNPTEQGTYIK